MSTARIPGAAAAAVLTISLAALAGWHWGGDVAWLRGLGSGEATMNPTTALAFVLLAVTLSLAPARGVACAAAVTAIGLLRLSGYVFGFDPGLDRLLYAERIATPSRMAPQTALSLLLIGAALVARSRSTRRARLAVQMSAIASAIIALIALTAYAYDTRHLYGAMALNTSLAVLIVTVGVLWSQPEEGLAGLLMRATPGGVLTRRLVPSIVALPLLLGWLRLAGERAGLYDTPGGTALLVVTMLAVLVGLTYWSARAVDRADAERREVAVRYRLLFDRNPLPGWVFDLETLQFLAVNEAAVRGYGYSRDEFLAMTIKEIRPPEEVPGLLATVARTARGAEGAGGAGGGGSGGGVWRHRKKDGTVIEVEITSHSLPFGGRPAEIVLARDITARRRAEAALRASEERFRALAATANDAIISADSSGHITYVNPGAERMFGFAASEVEGRELTTLMPERFQGAHRAGLARYLATGEARVVGKTVELVGRRNDGTEFPLELSLAGWKRGSDVAFTGILRDITERRQAEEELRRYAAQLQASNAELDAFAYSVSHDLRAPLRSIDGFSQVLLEDYAPQLDDAGRDSLHRVRAASQRMGTLIDDLLKLARVTRAELRTETVDLSGMARDIATDLQRSAPERQVEFAIGPGITARGDARLLGVVLENLLRNSWKYTAKQSRPRIEFGVLTENGERVFRVRDNGAGFDMKYADKLFGVFQRLHAAAEFEGTGVGLATVRRIITRHGGRIWAEAAVDQGATFYFTL